MSYVRRSLCVICLLTLIGVSAPVLHGQEMLSTDLVMAADDLAADQLDKVRSYVSRWSQQLLAGKGVAEVSEARKKLQEPLRRPSAGAGFIPAYTQLILVALDGAPRHADALVRLNAMVVVGQLKGPGVVTLAARSVNDKHAGVRYWASKAIANGTGGVAVLIEAPVAKVVTKALVDAITAERDPYVCEQMCVALGGLRSPEARAAMLKVLDTRLQQYMVKGLSTDLRGEVSGLQRAQQGLIIDVLQKRAPLEEVRQFVTVVGKYLQVIAIAAQSDQGIASDVMPICIDLVGQSEQLLSWAVKQFDPNFSGKMPEIHTAIKAGLVPQFVLGVYDWVGSTTAPGLLQTTKINIPLKQLQLPAAKAG